MCMFMCVCFAVMWSFNTKIPVSKHGSLNNYQHSYHIRASLQTFVQYASFTALPFCHSVQADCRHFTCLPIRFIKLKLPERLGFCGYFLVIFFRRNTLDGHSGMPSMFWMSSKWRKANLKKHFVFFLFPVLFEMGSLPTCSLKKDIFVTQTVQKRGQEVSLSINPSNISFGPLFVSYCQQLSWNGKKWCYRTNTLPWMFITYVALFLKRKLERI